MPVEPMEELRYLVLAIQREGNRVLAAALKPVGVTPSQGEVLRLLDAEGGLTLSALGELLVCETGSNPSRLVDRLVSQGLIERLPDPDDRRYVRLELTPDGRQVASEVAHAEQHLYDELRRLVGGRPLTPALRLLRDLADGLPAGTVLARRRELARATSETVTH
jgi:DNA-binding MarR family transcriptional regulator